MFLPFRRWRYQCAVVMRTRGLDARRDEPIIIAIPLSLETDQRAEKRQGHLCVKIIHVVEGRFGRARLLWGRSYELKGCLLLPLPFAYRSPNYTDRTLFREFALQCQLRVTLSKSKLSPTEKFARRVLSP